jgi:Flp pilus assembly protein TadG
VNRRAPKGVGKGERDGGQAAVEVALVLPLVALLLLLLVQVGVLVRDQVLVVHAAREAARAAAVDERPDAARQAAQRTGLAADRLTVEARVTGPRRPGATVEAQVTYRAATDVPLVGRLFGDLELRGRTAMRVE